MTTTTRRERSAGAQSRLMAVGLGLALALATLAITASADASNRSLDARFATAQKLYEAGRFKKALPLFVELTAQTNSPNARLYVARCLDKMGRTPEAFDHMQQTAVDSVRLAEHQSRYAETRDAAASELLQMQARLGRIVLRNERSGTITSVTVNDRKVQYNPKGGPLGVRAGDYRIDVSFSDGRSQALKGRLKLGELAFLNLRDREGALESDKQGHGGAGIRVAGYVSLGLGAAALGGFTAMAIAAKNESDALAALCGDAPCPASEQDRIAAGRRLETAANVSLGVGSALIVAGATMVTIGTLAPASDESASRTNTAVRSPRLQVVPFGWGLALRGRF